MHAYVDGIWLVRLVVQRGIALIYLVAFISSLRQFPALLGERGLLPISRVVERISFFDAPSIFQWRSTDRFARGAAWVGAALALAAAAGVVDAGPVALSAAAWLVLWFLYLSFVNVGQRFYSFGWESMLAEAGFFAAFLGPTWTAPSAIPVLIMRWMLFRTELGAGLIKVRHDPCWRDFTCLYYHYETQPLPNPLSRAFHFLPKPVHRFSVAFSHFVQILVPFGLFAPQPVASVAGVLIIVHQLLLIVSGNYSWLNWLTVVLGFSALDDHVVGAVLPLAQPAALAPRSLLHDGVLHAVAGVVVALSLRPTINFFSKRQLMNFNFNPLHLVNAYGAFGSVSKERYEVIVEGTRDEIITDKTEWIEYEFKAKPGRVRRRPPQVAPYHLRLDWLMWFIPFSVQVTRTGVVDVPGYESWFLTFVQKLLENDAPTLRLMRKSPFGDKPPRFIRAQYYLYRFTTREERKETGDYWHRTLVGEYLPPLSMATFLDSVGN